MKHFLTTVASVFLFAAAAYCLFGFLASFEPTDPPGKFLGFRIVYAAVGVTCLAAMAALNYPRLRR